MIRKYEILRCKIVRRSWSDSYFEEVENCIPTIVFSKYENDTDWKKDFEHELDEPAFNEAVPPFFRIHAYQVLLIIQVIL